MFVSLLSLYFRSSDSQKQMTKNLSDRASKIHSGAVDPKEDNMLKITSDGRKLGLDQRMQQSVQNVASDREALQKSLWAMEARDRELDKLFERIYEDNVSGKLTDERFARMSERYDSEQKELAERIKAARKDLEKTNPRR